MLRLLEEQARRFPDDPTIHRRLAELHRRRGDVDSQVGSLEEALRTDPENAANLQRLGQLYFDRMDRPCDAAVMFERLTALQPENAVAWRLLGRARARCDDAPGAVSALQRAIELAPDELRVYSEMALALSDLRRYDEAIRTVEQAVSRDPDAGYAYVTWGDILRDKGMAQADSAGNVPYEAKLDLEAAMEKYDLGIQTGTLSPDVAQYAARQREGLEPFRRTRAEIFMNRARDRIPPPPSR
jgi:tetratricopeptide (TPR) repeat protein